MFSHPWGSILDDEARGHLRAVLRYLVECETDHYRQSGTQEREDHIYTHALYLMQRFGFDDLLEDGPDEEDPDDWWKQGNPVL
jgi:hypothetical protein